MNALARKMGAPFLKVTMRKVEEFEELYKMGARGDGSSPDWKEYAMFFRRQSTTAPARMCGVCGLEIEGAQVTYCTSITTRDYNSTFPTEVMAPCHPSCVQNVLEERVVKPTFGLQVQRPEETMTTAERFETLRADPSRGQLKLLERHLFDLASNS